MAHSINILTKIAKIVFIAKRAHEGSSRCVLAMVIAPRHKAICTGQQSRHADGADQTIQCHVCNVRFALARRVGLTQKALAHPCGLAAGRMAGAPDSYCAANR